MPANPNKQILELLEKRNLLYKYNRIEYIFPDEDIIDFPYAEGKMIHSRSKYAKHIDFIKAGSTYAERAFIAGNRCGKTLTGCYEMAVHLTGLYPDWWEGKRFDSPIRAWAVGKTNKDTRDILQLALLGPKTDLGSGLIPKHLLAQGKMTSLAGVGDAVDTITIPHVNGGFSTLGFKSYESGVEAFVGTSLHFIHLDECVPYKVYTECLTRILDTGGCIINTVTPLMGLTDSILHFIQPSELEAKNVYAVSVYMDDVPHLSQELVEKYINSVPEYERECRRNGVPFLGSGKIYTVPESDLLVEPFEISRWWPRIFGMDVGYSHPTAVVWGAWDRESDIVYLYSEYKQANAVPSTHAAAILARGKWIPGIIDTSSQAASATDGEKLVDMYRKFGLELGFVKKGGGSVEEGILDCSDRIARGGLKVFNNLTEWINEYRMYRRTEGKIVKTKDDLMDATRYLLRSGLQRSRIETNTDFDLQQKVTQGRSLIGGY